MAQFAKMVRASRPWTCRENTTYSAILVSYYDVTICDNDTEVLEMVQTIKRRK